MPSPEILDFATLLEPIPGDSPTGKDLREDYSPSSSYHAMKDARSNARAIERQLLMDAEGAGSIKPDWRPILEKTPKILSQQSKDLELTAWFTEALVRHDGFAGLRDGFRLMRELVEKYWDNLYPMPDEDGIATRVAPLTGLNGEGGEGTLIAPILDVPITGGKSVGPFTRNDYQQAAELETIQDASVRSKRIARGAVEMSAIEKAVAETPPAFFQNLVDDLNGAADEFAKLTETLDNLCGNDAPPSSNVRNALADTLDAVNAIARGILEAPAAEQAPTGADAPAAGSATTTTTKTSVAVGAITTREEAFRQLLQLADFFRRTEPHTPISYGIEQIVRWGKMPLPQLLSELITDANSRNEFFKMVGIPAPEPPST